MLSTKSNAIHFDYEKKGVFSYFYQIFFFFESKASGNPWKCRGVASQKAQFYIHIQLVNRPHFGTGILLFGQAGQ